MDMHTYKRILSTRTMSRWRGSNMTNPAVVPGNTAAPQYIYLYLYNISIHTYIYIYLYSARTISWWRGSNMTKRAVVPGKTAAPRTTISTNIHVYR